MLIEKGYLTHEEVAAGHAMQPAKALKHGKFDLTQVERIMVRGKFARPAPAPAKFKIGDRVRAKNIHPATHTRLPRYVRGHIGIVETSTMAATCFRTRRRWSTANIRNGFTPSCSKDAISGARTAIRP